MSSRMLPGITENAFLKQVLGLAKLFRWPVYHPRPARTRRGTWKTPMIGDPGWPDVSLARGGDGHPARLILAELKSDHGVLSPGQREWLIILRQVPGVEAFVWYPSDWDEIV